MDLPVPRRNANLFRVVVQPEDRASLVCAHDNVRLRDTRQGIVHLLRHEGLPSTINGRHVHLRVRDDGIDERRLAQRPDDDGRDSRLDCRCLVGYFGGDARNFVDVGHEVGRGLLHARPFVLGDEDGRRLPAADDRKTRGRSLERDASVLPDSMHTRDGGKEAAPHRCSKNTHCFESSGGKIPLDPLCFCSSSSRRCREVR